MATAPLIMLTGKLKSGKTTLAEELTHLLDIPRDSFARPLKAGLKAMGVIVDGPDKDRHALQYFGADYFRKKDPDWWVKPMATNHLDMHNTGLVIDDCRFPNEYQWGKDNGFLMVRLKIRSLTQIKRGADYSQLNHISEIALDPVPDSAFDLVLDEYTGVSDRAAVIMAAAMGKFALIGGD